MLKEIKMNCIGMFDDFMAIQLSQEELEGLKQN